jgi:hypothetical protein
MGQPKVSSVADGVLGHKDTLSRNLGNMAKYVLQ